jgi:hypothetical protein
MRPLMKYGSAATYAFTSYTPPAVDELFIDSRAPKMAKTYNINT